MKKLLIKVAGVIVSILSESIGRKFQDHI